MPSVMTTGSIKHEPSLGILPTFHRQKLKYQIMQRATHIHIVYVITGWLQVKTCTAPYQKIQCSFDQLDKTFVPNNSYQ